MTQPVCLCGHTRNAHANKVGTCFIRSCGCIVYRPVAELPPDWRDFITKEGITIQDLHRLVDRGEV